MNTFLIIFLIVLFAVIVPGTVVLGIRFSRGDTPERRGIRGEREVSSALESLGGTVLNNYLIENGKAIYEIDHIYVSAHGVFVIETKARRGTVKGNINDAEWTQIMGNGNIIHSFGNPVLQNDKHLRKIKKLLADGTPVFSCVVFTEADVSGVCAKNVFNIDGLLRFIQKQAPRLTQENINIIIKTLGSNRSSMTLAEYKKIVSK